MNLSESTPFSALSLFVALERRHGRAIFDAAGL